MLPYMKKMLIAIALACLIPWNYAKADDGPFITELGALQPLKESQIRMESEDVVFTYGVDGIIKGKVTFNFVNTTDRAVELDTIFPLEGNAGDEQAIAYAKNVTVKVGGRAVKTETKRGYYPERDGQGELVTSPKVMGIVFPLSFAPHGKVQVEVSFEPDVSGWIFPGFLYLVGSGAGWAGNIGQADFSVIYPIDLQKGWVEMDLIDDSSGPMVKPSEIIVSGRKTTYRFLDLEPGNGSRVVAVDILPLSKAKKIIEAQDKVKTSPEDPESYWNLAETFKGTVNRGLGVAENEYRRPEFTKQGYWEAVDKAVALERKRFYVNESFDSVTAVYKLLKLYSNEWDADCRPGSCIGLVNPEKYQATLGIIDSDHSNSWFGRNNGDDELIAYIKDMDKSWRHVRPDLFPITSSTAELVSPQPAAEEVKTVEPIPQLTYLDASSIMNDKALASTNEKEYPPIFWFLVGFAGAMFSWSAWLWLTRRKA